MTEEENDTPVQKIEKIQKELEGSGAKGFAMAEEINWSHRGFSILMSEKFLMSALRGVRYASIHSLDYKTANLLFVQNTIEKYGIKISKLWDMNKLSRSSGTIRISFPYYFDGGA
jgi:hypothetical protein